MLVVVVVVLFLVQIFEHKIRGNVFLDSINVSHSVWLKTQKFAKFRGIKLWQKLTLKKVKKKDLQETN